MKGRFWRRLLAIFFPERCHFCGTVILPETELCDKCRVQEKMATIFPPVCLLCGREKKDCRCRKHRRMFERSVSAYTYKGVVNHGVIRFKRLPADLSAAFYAEKLAQVVRREYTDAHFDGIVPVPSSVVRQKLRSENPPLQLAKALSMRLEIPVMDVLEKIYETRPQKELRWRERQGNLLGAIDVKEGASLAGKRYLLVDDVITSGATLNECAKMLKIYGAEQVFAVTIAASSLNVNEKKR